MEEKAVITKSYSIHIEASPETVFDYVSDVTGHPGWAHEKLEMARVEGVTGEFAYTVHFMGTTKGRLRIIRAERPSVFSYECDDPSGLYRWTFGTTPEGSGSRLTHTIEFIRDSLKVKLTRPFMLPLVGNRMVEGGLANIKGNLEARVPAQA
jgi:uncharacterized protein YndB with AHSA1/START domain